MYVDILIIAAGVAMIISRRRYTRMIVRSQKSTPFWGRKPSEKFVGRAVLAMAVVFIVGGVSQLVRSR